MIQDKEHELMAQGKTMAEAMLGGAEEYSIECALLKVLGSETIDYVVDEGVQIFGGMGYSADMSMDRAYRDSRINRIFEGTNEINRMLGVDMVLRRAMKGQLNVMGAVMSVMNELTSIPSFGDDDDGKPLPAERKAIANFKKAILMVAGGAAQKYMQALETEQEIIMNIADMALLTYAAESGLLRALKLISTRGADKCKDEIAMVQTYIYDCADLINKHGKDAINSFAEGDMQRMMLMGLKRYTKVQPVNTKELRRQIAAKIIEKNDYCW
jgi:hypothetical protein